MNSPITGKTMVAKIEPRELEFRREKFKIEFHYFYCSDSDSKFTSTAQDELNMEQVYNQYRDKHHIPFPEEIKSIRENYELPASKMSEILGLGINGYRNYESGEIPSASNAKLILLAANPYDFKKLIDLSDNLEPKAKSKILEHIQKIIKQNYAYSFEQKAEDYLLSTKYEGIINGYTKPNLKKLGEMIQFFTENCMPWKTQINKLLFYADFYHFQTTCHSISGLPYRAIQMGPVPNRYQSIYEHFANIGIIEINAEEKSDGTLKEQLKPSKRHPFKPLHLSEPELSTLQTVLNRLKPLKTQDIINLSHEETGWKEMVKNHELIPYSYAFQLKGIGNEN